jgi:3-dehydroquinate dehydratase / shikimate dehydrogenase
LINLFKLGKKFEKVDKKIIIGMGKYGLASRILYRKLGSLLTFCSSYDPQAVGLLSAKVMKELYHADQVNSETSVFGVIGDPVGKSVSPAIHNLGFQAKGQNSVYVPFNVDDVRAFFVLADLLKIKGFSVTVPHKVHVLPYLGRTSREVRRIGSCNTVVRQDKTWYGSNTDYYGFLELIKRPLETGQIKNALVLGAGGGARAIVWALRNHNVNVTILNRTLEHARSLAIETSSNYGPFSDVSKYSGNMDLIVQTSSMGMDCTQVSENDPARDFEYKGSELVCDLVYRPQETAFLLHAQKAGCKIIHGIDMLIAQGKLQFKTFTGEDYPEEITVKQLG